MSRVYSQVDACFWMESPANTPKRNFNRLDELATKRHKKHKTKFPLCLLCFFVADSFSQDCVTIHKPARLPSHSDYPFPIQSIRGRRFLDRLVSGALPEYPCRCG